MVDGATARGAEFAEDVLVTAVGMALASVCPASLGLGCAIAAAAYGSSAANLVWNLWEGDIQTGDDYLAHIIEGTVLGGLAAWAGRPVAAAIAPERATLGRWPLIRVLATDAGREVLAPRMVEIAWRAGWAVLVKAFVEDRLRSAYGGP